MPTPANISGPILIGGAGRSGTTWVLDNLASHPDVQYVPENSLAYTTYREICSSWWSEIFLRLCCETDKDIQTQKMVDLVRQMLCQLFPGTESSWALKIIWGVESTWGVPLQVWRQIFPHAIYIHCARDPRTTIPSILEYLGNYSNIKDIASAEIQFQRGHQDMFVLKEMGVPYHLIRQEEIAENPQHVLKKLLDFCRLPPCKVEDEQLLTPRATNRKSGKETRPGLEWGQLSARTIEIAKSLGYKPPADYVPPEISEAQTAAPPSVEDLQRRISVLSTENLELKQKLRDLGDLS